MPSRVFNGYSWGKKREVIEKLLESQDGLCSFCDRKIKYTPAMDINELLNDHEVDHIKPLTDPLARDDDSNWALLHKQCNKIKGARPLFLAKSLYNFQKDRQKYGAEFTLGRVIEIFGINSQAVLLKAEDNCVEFRYNDYGIEKTLTIPVWKDPTGSPFDSIFLTLPLICIFHDKELNPRSIGENATKLIEEFYKEKPHPQLHVCLCRLEEIEDEDDWKKAKILLFDGQHKAVAQIYNDRKYLPARIFIAGDKDELKETNWRAHTDLRQIEFYRSIAARVGSGLFAEKFKEYLNSPGKPKSEQLFVNSLPYIERNKVKKEFQSWLAHGILHPKEFDPASEDNLMTPYIEEEKSRKRNKPISYDASQKTFMKYFVYTKPSKDEIDPESEEYFRITERENVVKLMSIIAEKVLINQFDDKIGAHKLEERVRKGQRVPDSHIRAYRIFRPRSFEVWCKLLRDSVITLLRNRGKLTDTYAEQGKVFWCKLDDNEWREIEKMINRIIEHKIWLSKKYQIVNAINSTRKEICQKLLTEGKIEQNQVFDTPLNFQYIMGVRSV